MSIENNTTPAAPDTNTPAAAPDAPAGDNGSDAADEDLLGEPAPTGEPEGSDEGKAGDQEEDDDLLDGKVAKGEEQNPAPEDYEFKIPEGYEQDAELTDAFKPVAKELGLSQDQAQGLVEKFGPQMLAKIGERQAAQWKDIQRTWANEFKNDPEYGGKNLEVSLGHVARARDFLGPDFTAAIKLTGGNNNPAILKALAKVGKALGEDEPGFGRPAAKAKTALETLYPNDQPKE